MVFYPVNCFTHKIHGILPSKSGRKVDIPNKYSKDTAVNLLANWNTDKFNNVLKIFELNSKTH